MNTIDKHSMMKKAHQVARRTVKKVGDYMIALKLALKNVWDIVRGIKPVHVRKATTKKEYTMAPKWQDYSFEDYCEDMLDQDPEFMDEEVKKDAIKGYRSALNKMRSEDPKHQKALSRAKESRQLAKFYGGKALTGTAKQKAWAEDIRQKFLNSDATSFEEKAELTTCGGFTNTAKFWIENRFVPESKMTARNIVAAYRGLQEVLAKHERTLSHTGSPYAKEQARNEINNYRSACGFKFEKTWNWEV